MNLSEAKQILKRAGYLLESKDNNITGEITAGESNLIYIGDPGYVLNDNLYEQWDYKHGEFYLNGQTIMFSVPTCTDGQFDGQIIDYYKTDTATIALIPVEYCKYKSNEELDAHGIWGCIIDRGSLRIHGTDSKITIDCQGEPIETITLHKN